MCKHITTYQIISIIYQFLSSKRGYQIGLANTYVKEFAVTLNFFFFNPAINISQPSFSGTDDFGYTSFLAYSAIPNITFYYEFRLKFQLANHHSALQENLIFFTGQKGHGKLCFYYPSLQHFKYSLNK